MILSEFTARSLSAGGHKRCTDRLLPSIPILLDNSIFVIPILALSASIFGYFKALLPLYYPYRRTVYI